MPCGGIYPLAQLGESYKSVIGTRCWVCGEPVLSTDVFCFEWDTGVNKKCVDAFLKTREGKLVIDHGHEVVLD